ncbi:MAG: relaxase/mobilization nuclease domain-containing protein [Almyronema sp.]
MAIVNAQTTKDFRATHRYVAVREDKQPQIIHSSVPQGIDALLGQAIDPTAVAEAMTARAAKSDRVEKPCYHISISVAEEDELSKLDWHQLATGFLEKTGLDEHQAVSYLHEDTTYPDSDEVRPHLHLVVNRVGEDGTAVPTSWDYYRFQNAIREVEQEMGLISEPNSWEVEQRRDPPGQVHRLATEQAQYKDPEHPRIEPPEPTVRSQLQDAIAIAIEQATSVEGITGFLEKQGIDSQVSDRGWSLKKEGIAFAGSQLGRAYSMNAIEQIMAEQSPEQNEQIIDAEWQPAEPDSEEGRKQRQKQRQRSMKQIMQETADAEEGSRDRQQTGRKLKHSGKRLSSESPEVDGMTFIGGTVAAAGGLLELGEKFGQEVRKARSRAHSQRATEQIDKLEEIGDRTTALEKSLVEQAEDQPGIGTQTLGNDLVANGQSPTEKSLNLANERISAIGDRLGIEMEEAKPIELDPTAPIGRQLDQMDEAIAQIDQRLGTLENAVGEIAQSPVEPELGSRPTGDEVAQSLENFVQARTEFRSETEPSAFDSSAGTVELSREGFQGRDSRLTVTDPDYGTVLEATKAADGDWQTQIDELSDEQAQTISQLPQSAQEYGEYKQGQQLVDSLRSLPQTADEFAGDRGHIRWNSPESGFDYEFSIERQADGTQQITGQDQESGEQVFSAQIGSEDAIFVEQNNIPGNHTNELLTQKERELSPPDKEAERSRTPRRRSKQRELEL